MKLFSSFLKELTLATRSFYFYIEIIIAVIILVVLLFAIPTHSTFQQTEYMYFDIEAPYDQLPIDQMTQVEGEVKIASAELEANGETIDAMMIESEEHKIYVLGSEEDLKAVSEANQSIGIVMRLDETSQPQYTYYLQGYESERLQNLLRILHAESPDVLQQGLEAQEVRAISSDYIPLNDRENTIPPLMTFSGSLMSMFIMAAYIFLDKKEGVIRAYAVTATPVSRYLLSKVFVLMLTSLVTGLIVVAPIMGAKANYALLLLLLLTSGFFASVLGLLLSSFYTDMAKAFGVIFVLVIVFMVPGIAYFIPSWDPLWIRFIPSYPLQEGFKEVLLQNGDMLYALLVSAGFAAAAAVLFALTNIRYKKTLSV